MSWQNINPDKPPRELLAWGVFYRDEPRKGAPAVDVAVWIPMEIARKGIMAIADYLERKLGWKVHRHSGWSSGSMLADTELAWIVVKVRAREIRAGLAERAAADA